MPKKIIPEEALKLFQSLPKLAKKSFEVGGKLALDILIGQIQKKYYSGRPGLNRINATLVNSWSVVVDKDKSSLSIATDCKYGIYHDKSRDWDGWDGWIKFKTSDKRVFLPVRTDVGGYFKDNASDLIINSWTKSFDSLLKKS